jgi:thiamine-monophosphate kinase
VAKQEKKIKVGGEFALIQNYFRSRQSTNALDGVELGIGDDCALLRIASHNVLAVSMDTLVADVHFPANAAPAEIAQRAVRVNLSDLAAMGATPRWLTLALTLPVEDEVWLQDFAEGFFEVCEEYNIALVGGDTTRGPMSLTLQVHGEVVLDQALKRSGAKSGDVVYVSGSLGDGAAGLAVIQQQVIATEADADYLLRRYYQPRPQLQLGQLLAGLASSAIDVSDGLLADLSHICRESEVGAQINVDAIPLSDALVNVTDNEQALNWALAGGDDYRLCFTVAAHHIKKVQQLCAQQGLLIYPIGEITQATAITCFKNQEPFEVDRTGYNHF